MFSFLIKKYSVHKVAFTQLYMYFHSICTLSVVNIKEVQFKTTIYIYLTENTSVQEPIVYGAEFLQVCLGENTPIYRIMCE